MKIRISDRIVDVDRCKDGMPVIKATAEEIPNANGGQDVIVHVPCMQMGAEPKLPEGMSPDPLKERLTDEFLLTLIMAAERYGWIDIEMFVRMVFEMSGRDISNIPLQTELADAEKESIKTI